MDASSLLGLGAFGFALVLTPLVRDLVSAWGWFDLPDRDRKIHSHPVPRVGGIPILLACGTALALLTMSSIATGGAVARVLPSACRLAPAILVIFATGLADDLAGLRPWQKLAGQLLAASLACWAGVGFEKIAGCVLPGWFAVPLTLVWLAACANAYNLIDGIDGLATGAALFASLTLFVCSIMLHHSGLALVSATLAGALLGFLPFNFRSASIFLGDCGSLSIGFLLGCCAIVWCNHSETPSAAVAPAMALAVPLVDTALTVVRRVVRRRPIFAADRDHIHHRLLSRGASPARVALTLCAASALASVFALAESVATGVWALAIAVFFCLAVVVAVHRLGYAELRAASRVMSPASLLGAASAEARLHSLDEALRRSKSVDECWDAICGACRDLGFDRAAMRAAGVVRDCSLQKSEAAAVSWTMRVPLPAGDWINFSGDFASSVQPSVVAPLASLLREAMESRLVSLQPGLIVPSPPSIPAIGVPLRAAQ